MGPDFEGKKGKGGLGFNMPDIDISLPKWGAKGSAKGPKVDGPDVDLDVNAKVDGPDVDVKIPKGDIEVDGGIDGPDFEGKKGKGGFGLNFPDINFPKFGGSAKGPKGDGPDLD